LAMAREGGVPLWDPGRVSARSRLSALARLVRIEHTLFSLPFAYAGAVLACPRCLDLRAALLIGLAVLGLRTAAMAFNNIADLDIDRLNPRTRSRPLVTGAVKLRDAWLLVALGSLLYYTSAALLNRYALVLSPILWLLAMTYPYAKRLHWLPHLHLGLVLGLVVFGGAVAVLGYQAASLSELLACVPWLYVVAVALWVAGFDAYYSILDMEFDRSHGVGSVAARLGPRGSLLVSRLFHAAAAALLAASVPAYGLGPVAAVSIAAAVGLLVYQHLLLARRGLEAIPEAFNVNLLLGLVVGLGVLFDRLLALL
jgi:4-hydroxybenzoate polyprenyltransferase